jgi:tryptophanyl-tRNA synthetase
LTSNIREVTAAFIAAGVDPTRHIVFNQSQVAEHAELAWIFNCVARIGWLNRMTQFKEKAGKDRENASVGLYAYPTLMAADILVYRATHVPVGEDQKQHLELTRDLAQKFNRTYSETFIIPEPFIAKTGARIMSLQNPTSKMSKSDPHAAATVFITDTPDEIRQKIGSAVTDSGSEVRATADKPGVMNLLQILSACTGKSVPVLEESFAGKGYGDFKRAVTDAIVATLSPVRERFALYSTDRTELDRVLKLGAEGAQKTAYKTLSKVYRKVGFVERPR